MLSKKSFVDFTPAVTLISDCKWHPGFIHKWTAPVWTTPFCYESLSACFLWNSRLYLLPIRTIELPPLYLSTALLRGYGAKSVSSTCYNKIFHRKTDTLQVLDLLTFLLTPSVFASLFYFILFTNLNFACF